MIIKVASHSGYCFGVKKAVEIAEKTAAEAGKKKVYTYGPLIHNKQAVSMLEKSGIIEISDLSKIHGEKVIFRSHGVGKDVYDYCNLNNIEIIDATCPYVKKIHDLVHTHYNDGYDIYIVGSKDHPEIIGINGWCENNAVIVSDDLKVDFGDLEKAIVVAQTTITEKLFDDATDIIKNKYKNLLVFNTICSATRNRQKSSIELAKQVDMMIVVGGKHSSNTQKLYNICLEHCKNTVHIETVEELMMTEVKKYDKIGITAGASTPGFIIKEIINKSEN
ncbi:MAG: 4-hydroxy-3-methylbut-2-enyl diphosphate reductase [Acidaminobacteraceae bacterium]